MLTHQLMRFGGRELGSAGERRLVQPHQLVRVADQVWQAGMPTGAHAADTIVAELRGRRPEPFDFGYIHQPISLGRGDALIQFVRRDDTPVDRMLTGAVGAKYKRFVSGGAITALRMERRIPGFTRWPSAPADEQDRADPATDAMPA
jgi:hypothetical protein